MEQPGRIVAVDRLSELHVSIITRILSLLPTKSVIQTCVLSKQWRDIWTLVPTIDFNNCRDLPQHSGFTAHQRYIELITHSLEQRLEACEVSKFKLHINFPSNGCQTALVDRWLRFPLARNVKELDLCFRYINPYRVPSALFRCLRELVILKLEDADIDIPEPSILPRLKVFHLTNAITEDRDLRNLFSGCVCIEELVLGGCFGLINPHVSSLSLKSMEVQGNVFLDTESITIEAPNLLSFAYKSLHDDGRDKCSVNLSNCKQIRKLSLRGLALEDQWFEDLVSRAPLLEDLSIVNCHGFQHIRISYEHLKKFEFTSKSQLAMKTVTIDAPSLVFLRFSGCSIFNISVKAPNLKDSIIQISNNSRLDFNSEWYD